MDLVWIVVVLGFLVAIAIAYGVRQHRQRLTVLKEAHQKALKQVQEDAERRVKRIELAAEQAQNRAEQALIRDLMPIADALMSAEDVKDAHADSVTQGLRFIHQEFDRVLEKHGVQKLLPLEGDVFDPTEHEAVEQREVAVGESNRIAQCYRAGFRQGGDVLRPAMVAVSCVATELSFPKEDDRHELEEVAHPLAEHVITKAD